MLPGPSPEILFQDALSDLHVMFGQLREAMLDFLQSIIHDSPGYEGYGDSMIRRVTYAEETFRKLSLQALTVEQSEAFEWTAIVSDFWIVVQPRGYLFTRHADPEVACLVRMVYDFGYDLGLQLQDPNMTDATPQATLLATYFEDRQATSAAETLSHGDQSNTYGPIYALSSEPLAQTQIHSGDLRVQPSSNSGPSEEQQPTTPTNILETTAAPKSEADPNREDPDVPGSTKKVSSKPPAQTQVPLNNLFVRPSFKTEPPKDSQPTAPTNPADTTAELKSEAGPPKDEPSVPDSTKKVSSGPLRPVQTPASDAIATLPFKSN